jgi:acid phosphatase family membrane protein YuiD
MSLTGWIYVTAAALAAVLAGIVMVTRRVIRTVPGSAVDSRAMTELVAELRRANDLAERRMAALETRVEALERRTGHNPG